MHKFSYEQLIKAIENKNTEDLIGKIDIDVIKQNIIESLYYEFPLIERIVLEIYKLLPLSDVEYYQQGTMRTILAIINKDSNDYLPEELIVILQKYYGDKGLRNKLFHVEDDIGIINVSSKELNFDELKFAIMQLLSILRKTCEKYTIECIGKIKYIK